MTRDKAKKLIPLIKAYADGKIIQIGSTRNGWSDIDSPNFDAINLDCWRIKPEPHHRPWKPEEVPIGNLFRLKRWVSGVKSMILANSTNSSDDFTIAFATAFNKIEMLTAKQALEDGEHSADNGKTWQPCGVLVEE